MFKFFNCLFLFLNSHVITLHINIKQRNMTGGSNFLGGGWGGGEEWEGGEVSQVGGGGREVLQ